jgi:hypothetical protein
MQIIWRMDNSGVRERGRSSVWLRLPHLPFLRRGCSASSASEWEDRHRAALTLSRQKFETKPNVRFWHKAEMLNALTDIRFHTRRQRGVWPIQDAAYEINDALSAIAQEVQS